MKCDLCDKKATVFLTQLVNGEMKKVKLCQSCAESQGVTDPTGFALADFLIGDSPASQEESGAEPVAAPATQVTAARGACPNCGFTLDDLKRIGRLGCSQCYAHFRGEITPMLRNMHGGSTHHGKVPALTLSAAEREARVVDLRKRLQAAIEAEDFELAADLRDQINDAQSA